ncbi:MAG: hypothetical protein HY023_19360, partial [Chloroflexi bacterium]|nr:hypothetical protein [Chloroflexota bacterium]
MTQRNAFIVAIATTVFLLVMVGGVAARTAQNAASAVPAPTATTPATATVAASPTVDPAVEALIQQREAQYQELIQQANARLEEAYQQQQALADQLNTKAQPQAQTIAPTKPAAATYA